MPSIHRNAGKSTWSIGAVTSQRVSIWTPSSIRAASRTWPMWGEYHAPIANRRRQPERRTAAELAVGEQDRAGRDIRDTELRKGPRA